MILVKFLGVYCAHAQKGPIFRVVLFQNGEDWGIQTFRNESQDHDLALGSERESTGLNQTEKIIFKYWSCFVVLVKF